jgi:hypothetical protein
VIEIPYCIFCKRTPVIVEAAYPRTGFENWLFLYAPINSGDKSVVAYFHNGGKFTGICPDCIKHIRTPEDRMSQLTAVNGVDIRNVPVENFREITQHIPAPTRWDRIEELTRKEPKKVGE